MIHVGIDDTDTLDTPGTNQLARALAARVAESHELLLIVRHQLLFDPRVPYTSKNGSASMLLKPRRATPVSELIDPLRVGMREWFKPGSDPGLCVAEQVPEAVTAFGRRCQRELVSQDEARGLAAAHGIHLEGLGGTEGGVIGALAAVGLLVEGNDGRVVQHGDWPELSGVHDLATLAERGIAVRRLDAQEAVTCGAIDLGKRMRPNYRRKQVVLFVAPLPEGEPAHWQAVRLP